MLDALGDHGDVTGTQLGGAFPAAGFAQRDVELAVNHQEKLIGVLVDVPDVLTRGVRDLDVIIINPADNAWAVDIVEGGQCLAQADGRDCHASIIASAKTRVLYDLDVDAKFPGRCRAEAWAPQVPGIREVFHARLVDYAYPPHCHETWAVLIVDEGAIRYNPDRRRCGAAGQTVTILPPGVAHDGRPAPGAGGFRKRELYLDTAFLPAELTGAAVGRCRRHPRPQHPASGLMLRGAAPADVATAVGFYGQAHFTRHFKRHTAITPASYARSHARQAV